MAQHNDKQLSTVFAPIVSSKVWSKQKYIYICEESVNYWFFQEFDIENPFPLDTDFHNLSLQTKIIILNYLCDFRLDSTDAEVITAQFEADSLRIEPLGYDVNGSIYWYFFGTRLYREDIQKSNGKKTQHQRVWQVICFTEQDWQNLANKFKHSKSTKESALYKVLV